MEILEAIKGRRSIRKFKPSPIEPEKIEALKDALVWAPSAGNLQARRFYFVFESALKEALTRAALNQTFITEAPLAVVACADLRITNHYGERGARLYAVQDAACSLENMMLLAHSLGLGSVWVGAFREKEVTAALSLPEHLRPVAIVPVGYPDEAPAAPKRIPADKAIVEVK